MSGAVNKPAHYNQGQIECIDAMKIVLTPEEFRGYLKGNVFKYLWREKDKNGIEDIRKGKSYYDRLIELIDEYEQQKASDLQSLKDHPFGKLKQPEWIPKIGDWVKIRKPENSVGWIEGMMDEHDGKIVQVADIDLRSVVHSGWYFPFGWLEPAEQPAIKQSLITEPPDGWRWLEVGEVIRKGDQGFENCTLYSIEPIKIGMTLQAHWMPTIRRNRFEVGEKVVRVSNGVVYKVVRILSMGYQLESEFCAEVILHGKDLAPYIEDAK